MTDPTRQPGARDLTRADTDPTDPAADRLVPEADLAETATEPLPEPEGPSTSVALPSRCCRSATRSTSPDWASDSGSTP